MGYQLGNASPQRHVQPTVSGLDVPTEWVAQLTHGLEEVMNVESLELQAVFRSDHMVTFLPPLLHKMMRILLAFSA